MPQHSSLIILRSLLYQSTPLAGTGYTTGRLQKYNCRTMNNLAHNSCPGSIRRVCYIQAANLDTAPRKTHGLTPQATQQSHPAPKSSQLVAPHLPVPHQQPQGQFSCWCYSAQPGAQGQEWKLVGWGVAGQRRRGAGVCWCWCTWASTVFLADTTRRG